MKRALLLTISFLGAVSVVYAHPPEPVDMVVPYSPNVCLATVVSVEGNAVIFKVTETLHGTVTSTLTLHPSGDKKFAYEINSEWLLSFCPVGDKDTVGYRMEGYCQWIPAKVTREGGTIYVADWSFPRPDHPKGLTLDEVQRLIASNGKQH